jgi:SHS2 domain-containing protein
MDYRYPEDGPPADLTVEGLGGTLEEAIANVALGMFNAMSPIEGVDPVKEFDVEAEGHDMESLLFNLFDELLYIYDMDHLLASQVDVELNTEDSWGIAHCWGEEIRPESHEMGIAIKAVTFHQMRIEKKSDGWLVRVVFDT